MSTSITCPICGRTSWHPTDVAEGWCGNCHGATALPPPPGFRWVLFQTDDPLDRFGRLLEERWLTAGGVYHLLERRFVYDPLGGFFVETDEVIA